MRASEKTPLLVDVLDVPKDVLKLILKPLCRQDILNLRMVSTQLKTLIDALPVAVKGDGATFDRLFNLKKTIDQETLIRSNKIKNRTKAHVAVFSLSFIMALRSSFYPDKDVRGLRTLLFVILALLPVISHNIIQHRKLIRPFPDQCDWFDKHISFFPPKSEKQLDAESEAAEIKRMIRMI